MAKGKKITTSFSDFKHGKTVESGMHTSKLKHDTHGLSAKPQTSGHIDHIKPMHDAKHMDKGSRGPFHSANIGFHRPKD
jgi:hypothetical protein